MCFSKRQQSAPPLPEIKYAAPPPAAPPPPPAPKPMAAPKPLTAFEDGTSNPKVDFGRKKSEDVRARAQGANALRIPLNTGESNSGNGGFNV